MRALAIVSVLALMAACGGTDGGGTEPGTTPPSTGTVTGPIVLATQPGEPSTITVDDTNVYWVNTGSSGGVFKVPKAGGSFVALDRGHYDRIQSIGLDASTVYVVKDDKILGVPIDGSQPRVVSTTRSATTGVTARDGQLYWVDKNAVAGGGAGGRTVIAHVAATGGVASTLEATDDQTLLTQAITTTADAVYVLLSGGPVRVPFDNSPATRITTEPVATAGSFAVHGSELFFATTAGVSVVPTGGGEPTQIAKSSSLTVAIAADDASVYFTQFASERPQIVRMPKAGGAATVVADEGATSLAVDEASVYWSTSDGTIKKIAK